MESIFTHRLKTDAFRIAGVEPISMRVNDACKFTGISRSTLYLLIANGEIEIIKLGATTLVITDSLKRYIERKRYGVAIAPAKAIQPSICRT